MAAPFQPGTLHLINCTLSRNSAAGGVGGLVSDLSARGGNGGNAMLGRSSIKARSR